MLIPSIDLQGGQIVQLVQGERLALASTDIERWIARFEGYPRIQVIDLDAAKGNGDNSRIVAQICERLPCQVGGGIRTIERAHAILETGARRVILGSALFSKTGVDLQFAAGVSEAVGVDRLIAAVDSRSGSVVVNAWRTQLPLTAVEAVRILEPFAGEFLYTHVDREGLMQGTDMDAIRAVRAATSRRLIAAGGITTQEEIDYLDALGVDAVVGMALYTGRLRGVRS
jgi:phosphoribosylformimino-5-aminoimidazole carboxamide ribotide isomerase